MLRGGHGRDEADAGRPIIFNLPATVEAATPNIYADQIDGPPHIPNREAPS